MEVAFRIFFVICNCIFAIQIANCALRMLFCAMGNWKLPVAHFGMNFTFEGKHNECIGANYSLASLHHTFFLHCIFRLCFFIFIFFFQKYNLNDIDLLVLEKSANCPQHALCCIFFGGVEFFCQSSPAENVTSMELLKGFADNWHLLLFLCILFNAFLGALYFSPPVFEYLT